MNLSDFGSWASIISLVIGFVAGLFTCKNNNKQSNKNSNVVNNGNISQNNTSNQ